MKKQRDVAGVGRGISLISEPDKIVMSSVGIRNGSAECVRNAFFRIGSSKKVSSSNELRLFSECGCAEQKWEYQEKYYDRLLHEYTSFFLVCFEKNCIESLT